MKDKSSSASTLLKRSNREVMNNGINKENIENWSNCDYKSLPKWLQDNNYLKTGHRPPLPSFKLCFQSVFRLHTESGNIWTHGIGFLLFLFISITLLTSNQFKPVDKLMLSIFFFGVMLCHLLSSVYHTCKCHSPNTSQLFHQLDYCGISFQIICSMISAFYYAFHYRPHLMYIYDGLGIVLFMTALVISLWPKFGRPEYRPLRAIVFLSFGLSNIIPGIHWYLIGEPELILPFYLVVIHGMLYTIGAVIYALRVPEKYFAGKCDLWPQSHQIFHSLVTIAAVVHLISIYLMIGLRNI